MSVHKPEKPAVADYPTSAPHQAELEAAKAFFLRELESPEEEWEDQGEREEVHLWSKKDPEVHAVPTVKGETLFLGGVVQLPGMRKLWDQRFESGHMLARYDRTSFAFYTVMKGMGWLVYPRDIVGIQKNFHPEDGSETSERMIVQTSIEEKGWAPEQKGKTRATLTVSGWRFTPVGDDLKVTYIVKIALNGSMPIAMVSMVATETPLCTGRARDVYYQYGHAPYIRLPAGTTSTSIIFQTESFSDPPANPETDDHVREYRCVLTTGSEAGEAFELVYDANRMYSGGIVVRVEGEGVETSDDGKGVVRVKTSASGKDATVVIAPK
ncbi:lipid-binding START containing protein [Rhodotorula toruloides]|uniref:Lipid-binding START containing protein n=1 Tax=Rhodotorula toruloides TaxID=5286 RepID=A0A511K9L5_RHOTO|nr:lipid-binding START containing protein [Rhodotorula toruloides]